MYETQTILPLGVLLSMLALSSSSLVQVILLFKSWLVGRLDCFLGRLNTLQLHHPGGFFCSRLGPGRPRYLTRAGGQLKGRSRDHSRPIETQSYFLMLIGWNPSASRYPNDSNEVCCPTLYRAAGCSRASCESLGSQRLRSESEWSQLHRDLAAAQWVA